MRICVKGKPSHSILLRGLRNRSVQQLQPPANAPTIMQFSAAWGLPFRSVVHHATFRWLYEFTLPEQHFMERYPDA